MEKDLKFKTPANRQEFLSLFSYTCGIAEVALFKFDTKLKELNNEITQEAFKHDLSYMISIAKFIRGLRGDFSYFIDDTLRPFFMEKDGITYDQNYLYKSENYICEKIDILLEILKKDNEDDYKYFLNFWRY